MNSSSRNLHLLDANLDTGAFYLLLQDDFTGKTARWCYTCCNLRFNCPDAIKPVKIHRSDTDDAYFTIEHKLGEFEMLAANGCRYCALLVKALRHHWPSSTLDTDIRLRIGGRILQATLVEADSQETHTLDIYSPHGFQPPWRDIPIKHEPSPDDDPDCAFPFLKDCLDSCLANHATCAQQDTTLPTRLLQVGTALEDRQVRLVEPAPGTRGRYVALSYCWGKKLHLRCMESNKKTLEEGFQSSELPRTLQDAVLLTIRLGLQYIWIDSICIQQDDAADWEHESSMMGDVYHRAYLTIAAASSPASETGFLTQRAMPESLHIPIDDEDGQPTVVCVRPILRSGFHGGRLEPWRARGWTLQEELLSTRLITYTMQELQWTCLSSSRCECGDVKPEFAATHTPLWRLSNVQDAFRMWQRHVVEYSDRHLSFPSDKLPAMAGLAPAFQSVVKCSYVAGMWLDNLMDDLTWCRQPPSPWSPPWSAPDKYRAPSWSWASVDGTIEYFGRYMGDGLVAEASIVGCAVRGSEGARSFGRVQEGWVQVRGAVVKSSLDTSDPGKTRVRLRGNDVVAQLDVGWDVVPFTDTDTDINTGVDSVIGVGDTVVRWAACRPFPKSRQGEQIDFSKTVERPVVWLLQLGRFLFKGSKYSNEVFLVLGRAPHDVEARYQRIGLLRLTHRDQSEWAAPFGKHMIQTVEIV